MIVYYSSTLLFVGVVFICLLCPDVAVDCCIVSILCNNFSPTHYILFIILRVWRWLVILSSCINYSAVIFCACSSTISCIVCKQLMLKMPSCKTVSESFSFWSQFLPRDAMHKRGLCRYTVSVRPSVLHVRVFCQIK